MSDEKEDVYHENLDESVIRRAYSGDSAALGEIIARYLDYVRSVIDSVTSDSGLDEYEVPVDDLAQIVWIKFMTRRFREFRKLD